MYLLGKKGKTIMLAALVLILVVALCLLAACVTDPPPIDPTPDPTPPPTPPEEQEMSITVNNVRISLLSDTLVRVEEKGAKGFEDRASYIVSNRTDWKKTAYTTSAKDGYFLIKTAAYTVRVPENAQDIKGVEIISASGEPVWKYDGLTTTNVYLPSPSDELDCWYFSDSPRIIPSEYGYTPTASDDPLQGWDFDNDAADFYVFLPGGDYKQFCSDYTSLTGKSEMVSLQMLGYWDSRWYAYSAETALQQIKDYTDKGYSLDVMVIDTDWRKPGANGGVGYDINTDLFPNMAEFLEQCHDLGINVMFNDHPEPVKGTENGLEKDEVEFRNNNLTMILSLGLDYWWYDRNWHVALESCDPDISVYAFGMYCYQWVTDEYLNSITDIGEYAERALIMGNVDGCLHGKWNYASDLSAHRYSIQWTGDIGSDSDALAQEIYAAVFGGAEVGLPYVSSDIGGHTSPVTDEMYSRWMQYGALSAICRVHCTNAEYIGQVGRMPWLFGETAEEVTKEYVGMRYRLLPLFYQLARENYDTGLPILRRTDIEYPQYVESAANDQYMLGENILIAPISEADKLTPVPTSWLTYTSGGQTNNGLQAKYYNNKTWSGTAADRIDANIDFDWGTGGPSGFGSDNFSIKWFGNITIGSKDAKLRFFADDGIEVYIDGIKVIDGLTVYDNLLSTDYYAAGTTHSIQVNYFEDGGNAHCFMYYTEREDPSEPNVNTRTVFIPDGTWIDVWTGERISGPQTITVSHELNTSPIYVRDGAVLALARDMKNTSEKDWSQMALDVYTGTVASKATLYEDDTYTQAYKDGKYRTTLIEKTFANGSYTIKIGAAQGTFSGAKAFDERTWNVRIHAPRSMGNIVSVTVNGEKVRISDIQFFAKNANASPFAYEGASADSDIYQFTVSGNVYEEMTIVFTFQNDAETYVTPEYDDTAVDFSLSAGKADDVLDLSEAGNLDWAYFGAGAGGAAVRKAGVTSLIGDLASYDSQQVYGDSPMSVSFCDGKGVVSAKDITKGIATQKDFSFTLNSTAETRYFVIYAGGYRSTAKLTVRDRAGNAKTVSLGNIDGNYLKRVVIECNAATASTLYVTYSVSSTVPSGTGSVSRVWLSAVYATDELPEINLYPVVETAADVIDSAVASGTVNLSEKDGNLPGQEVLDWAQFGEINGTNRTEKINGSVIDAVSFTDGRSFFDYAATMAWFDGEELAAHTGTRNGTCTPGTISVTLNVDQNTKYVKLYTGAYEATNTVYVYDRSGNLLATSQSFTAGSSAVCRVITIAVGAESETKINVKIVAEQGGNNVSLSAIQVLGQYESSAASVSMTYAEANGQTADLTEKGSRDWLYVGTNARKAQNDGSLDAGQPVYNGAGIVYNDYKAALSYTDGTEGSASGLTSGRASDYVRGTVKADGSITVTLYLGAYDTRAGLRVLGENGRTLYSSEEIVTGSGNFNAYVITLEITADEELTFVWYKGAPSGNVGITAIAVS